MTVLIARDLGLPPRREPLTVTQLRQQIARGASAAVLHRIAGSEADYRRLSAEYRLQGPPTRSAAKGPSPARPAAAIAPPPAPPKFTTWERRARLMKLVFSTAVAGEVFPPSAEVARLMAADTLAVEQDLRGLVRDGRIRVGWHCRDGEPARRIEVVGRNLFTALPPLDRPGAAR